jgi:hypothetical protein
VASASLRRRRGHFDALFRPITRQHLEAACRRVRRDEFPRDRGGRSTFVRFQGTLLPAKYVLGVAYHLATGRRLSPESYHGGSASARVFERLGLATVTRAQGQIARRRGRPRPASCVFVTVAIAGRPAKRPSENPSRLTVMQRVVERIREARWKPDVIIFPGGFFMIPDHLGPVADAARVKRLERLALSRKCRRLARASGATLVAGIDGDDWPRPGWADPDSGDQLCVAWTVRGIVGIGRKVFPTASESGGYTVYRADFATALRAPRLSSRRVALLCSCYDMFGCQESPRAPGTRARNIYWLGEGKRGLLKRSKDRREVQARVGEGLVGWKHLVGSSDVGLVAIHHFTRNGNGSGKGYWQRHGIEQASRHLKGRLAFGAAHFDPPLPASGVALLAAARAGRPLRPAAHFTVQTTGGPDALVRRFDVRLTR